MRNEWNLNVGVEAPCYKCLFREVGCHKDCFFYKKYKLKVEKVTRERRKSNDRNYAILRSLVGSLYISEGRKKK